MTDTTTLVRKPDIKPARPYFSSGPTAKRLGFDASQLDTKTQGRSHRSGVCKAVLKEAIDKTRTILGVPENYHIGIVPASDTGAVEMAMWSLLGPKPVTVMAWESFGADWVTDAVKQLKIDPIVKTADYGLLPDLASVDSNTDIVFTWNGTTSGARVPNADWIAADREGLTICDATSAAFAQELDWAKLDVVTFSWQKVMGGEAAHGVLILGPRAVDRLESHTPAWPMPKLFRMTKDGKLNKGIFEGATINTPSMMCVVDYIGALDWAASLGGGKALIAKSFENLSIIEKWAEKTAWIDFLCADKETRSNTGVCLKIIDPRVTALDTAEQSAFAKKIVSLLTDEDVAYDFGAYAKAPPGLRIWCGATIEADDLKALMPWLDWAFEQVCKDYFS